MFTLKIGIVFSLILKFYYVSVLILKKIIFGLTILLRILKAKLNRQIIIFYI